MERLWHAAIEIYAGLEDDGPHGCDLGSQPLLLVAADGDELAHAEEYARCVDGTPVDPRTERWLADGLAGAFAIEGSYSVEPMAAAAAMADAAERAGAEFELGVEVTRLSIIGDSVGGLMTDRGARKASRVVVAAGPATVRLLASAGVHLPLSAARGWLVEIAPLERSLDWVIVQALWPPQHEMATIAASPTLSELAAQPVGAPELVALLLGQRPSGSVVVGTSINRSLRDEPEGCETVQAIAANAARIVPLLAECTGGCGVVGAAHDDAGRAAGRRSCPRDRRTGCRERILVGGHDHHPGDVSSARARN